MTDQDVNAYCNALSDEEWQALTDFIHEAELLARYDEARVYRLAVQLHQLHTEPDRRAHPTTAASS